MAKYLRRVRETPTLARLIHFSRSNQNSTNNAQHVSHLASAGFRAVMLWHGLQLRDRLSLATSAKPATCVSARSNCTSR